MNHTEPHTETLGAHAVWQALQNSLKRYLQTQYFSRSPALYRAIEKKLDENQQLLCNAPYIESTPAYKTVPNGFQTVEIPEWLRKFFLQLAEKRLGVFPTPFAHQLEALESTQKGHDLFVHTGTGSGKTECFLWPILAKLVSEARERNEQWENLRGVRVLILYPMNALVSDQLSRLRRLLGSPEFLATFRAFSTSTTRRPQFGMYTGRTPYSGPEPINRDDNALAETLSQLLQLLEASPQLQEMGRVPAKSDLSEFIEKLKKHRHVPDPEDAEMITRFEMQACCPDILITNYSMLEYMLMRPREKRIWEDTRRWLSAAPENRLLFVLDEAHMYRGSAGGEVALLVRRLFCKLGIPRKKVQFILTTASIPDKQDKDQEYAEKFACNLTGAEDFSNFVRFAGQQDPISADGAHDIPLDVLTRYQPEDFENGSSTQLQTMEAFWKEVGAEEHTGASIHFPTLQTMAEWLYEHLLQYRPFVDLFESCRQKAVKLQELGQLLFPEANSEQQALQAISVLLAIAPLARNANGTVLFPVRMHMFFRGIQGLYACANEHCPNTHKELGLGDLFLSDSGLVCPHCGSMVYELYNDRRCGALFFHGFVLESDFFEGRDTNLWQYPGRKSRTSKDGDFMLELYLYIPPEGFNSQSFKSQSSSLSPCWLDIKSGSLYLSDDRMEDQPHVRLLYFQEHQYSESNDVPLSSHGTFTICPHCQSSFFTGQLNSFSTRGVPPFYSLIQTQFLSQPPAPHAEHQHNAGRKVLLFSDSRQRAATLALEMSQISSQQTARQLFARAIDRMEKAQAKHPKVEYTLDQLYGFFCLEEHDVPLFHAKENEDFQEHRRQARASWQQAQKSGQAWLPPVKTSDAPRSYQEYLLRIYCSFNAVSNAVASWLEPLPSKVKDARQELSRHGLTVLEQAFKELFYAWLNHICDRSLALGEGISDSVRREFRVGHEGFGLKEDWKFPQHIQQSMDWNEKRANTWFRTLKKHFLKSNAHGHLYVDLATVRPYLCLDKDESWCRCDRCANLPSFLLNNHCPFCGAESEWIQSLATDEDHKAAEFWRAPLQKALKDPEAIHILDTEEHTAQLSHKDQRDELWSLTEQYELRFQGLGGKNELPVDILSCTTTMEVGIDIGALVAVGLRNVPPTRENYQQRAGRAGRRGSSLSTIVTFCENGPHDAYYFQHPAAMLNDPPRHPWIDIDSPKLLQRHLNLLVLQKFLTSRDLCSMDEMCVKDFWRHMDHLHAFITEHEEEIRQEALLPENAPLDTLEQALWKELEKIQKHPRLDEKAPLLDMLWEEGLIPTFSFPKNVVSFYIDTKLQPERELNIAISEYAPGREIVVNKKRYQSAGFGASPAARSSTRSRLKESSCKPFLDNQDYHKTVYHCDKCGWFGLESDTKRSGIGRRCPFCEKELGTSFTMLRPWGFVPLRGQDLPASQIRERYTPTLPPVCSTLSDKAMEPLGNFKHIRKSMQTDQRILLLNRGEHGNGFTFCRECGAAMPKVAANGLDGIHIGSNPSCRHTEIENVSIGNDFKTDMLVLEFQLDDNKIDTAPDSLWLERASYSLAEGLRLAAGRKLDIEFDELIAGSRIRKTGTGTDASVDVYLYDRLSSGAGYAKLAGEYILEILDQLEKDLAGCHCATACRDCLKHYQNRYLHGILDRHAALQLLQWGQKGTLPSELSYDEQCHLLEPLKLRLESLGCQLEFPPETEQILLTRGPQPHHDQHPQGPHPHGPQPRRLVVYPAMWSKPSNPDAPDTIYISDFQIRYDKPTAVNAIFK